MGFRLVPVQSLGEQSISISARKRNVDEIPRPVLALGLPALTCVDTSRGPAQTRHSILSSPSISPLAGAVHSSLNSYINVLHPWTSTQRWQDSSAKCPLHSSGSDRRRSHGLSRARMPHPSSRTSFCPIPNRFQKHSPYRFYPKPVGRTCRRRWRNFPS